MTFAPSGDTAAAVFGLATAVVVCRQTRERRPPGDGPDGEGER